MASIKGFNLLSVRKFSTTSVANQLVKPPIQIFGIEGRYVTALYSAAVKQKQLEGVEKDLEKISSAFKTDKVFSEFVSNPVISKALKAAAVKEASAKLSLTPYTANFLGLLAENGRLKNIPTIANLFQQIMSAHRGDLSIEITTAKVLDEASKDELQAVLKKFAKKGEKLLLNYKVDQSILGGMIVSIGDKYVDMSTASKFKKYSDILKSTA